MPVFVLFVIVFKIIYVDNGLSLLLEVCIPIFAGLFIAIVLNPILIFIQTKLKIKNRGISIALTFLFFLVAITLLIIMVVPGIVQSIMNFTKDFPGLLNVLSKYIENIGDNLFKGDSAELYELFNQFITTLTQKVYGLATTLLNTLITSTINIISIVLNLLIALFISIYILFDKEHFENLFHRFCNTVLDKKNADEIIKLGYNFYSYITSFISGKLLDSLIIGVITFLGSAYIIKAPYALLISVLIGVTNMIPYFGPFIGGIPAIIITLLFDPLKGLWMAVFVLILQQFDGWFLGPKILGIKLEIKPVWIVIAIIIGGGIFGPIGMFLATPVAALIKTIMDGYMALKLKDKNLNLPHGDK